MTNSILSIFNNTINGDFACGILINGTINFTNNIIDGIYSLKLNILQIELLNLNISGEVYGLHISQSSLIYFKNNYAKQYIFINMIRISNIIMRAVSSVIYSRANATLLIFDGNLIAINNSLFFSVLKIYGMYSYDFSILENVVINGKILAEGIQIKNYFFYESFFSFSDFFSFNSDLQSTLLRINGEIIIKNVSCDWMECKD